MSVHISAGSNAPIARCYDLRDESFTTLVKVDLLTFLPLTYGDNLDDEQLPHWQFVIASMQACAEHGDELWDAWEVL